jgi:hypothetical protein
MRTAYEVLVEESAGNRTISSSHESVNNIKMDFKVIVWKMWAACFLVRTGLSDGLLCKNDN